MATADEDPLEELLKLNPHVVWRNTEPPDTTNIFYRGGQYDWINDAVKNLNMAYETAKIYKDTELWLKLEEMIFELRHLAQRYHD